MQIQVSSYLYWGRGQYRSIRFCPKKAQKINNLFKSRCSKIFVKILMTKFFVQTTWRICCCLFSNLSPTLPTFVFEKTCCLLHYGQNIFFMATPFTVDTEALNCSYFCMPLKLLNVVALSRCRFVVVAKGIELSSFVYIYLVQVSPWCWSLRNRNPEEQTLDCLNYQFKNCIFIISITNFLYWKLK